MARRLVEILTLESYILQDDGFVDAPTMGMGCLESGCAFFNDPVIQDQNLGILYESPGGASLDMVSGGLLDGDVAVWGGVADTMSLGHGETGMDGRLIRTLVEEVVSAKLKQRS